MLDMLRIKETKNQLKGIAHIENVKINAFISFMLCIYFYNDDHKCMLSWFKMITMIPLCL